MMALATKPIGVLTTLDSTFEVQIVQNGITRRTHYFDSLVEATNYLQSKNIENIEFVEL